MQDWKNKYKKGLWGGMRSINILEADIFETTVNKCGIVDPQVTVTLLFCPLEWLNIYANYVSCAYCWRIAPTCTEIRVYIYVRIVCVYYADYGRQTLDWNTYSSDIVCPCVLARRRTFRSQGHKRCHDIYNWVCSFYHACRVDMLEGMKAVGKGKKQTEKNKEKKRNKCKRPIGAKKKKKRKKVHF